MELALHALQLYGWVWDGAWISARFNGGGAEPPYRAMAWMAGNTQRHLRASPTEWSHSVREALRLAQWRIPLAQRFRDIAERGPCLHSKCVVSKNLDYETGALRSVVAARFDSRSVVSPQTEARSTCDNTHVFALLTVTLL